MTSKARKDADGASAQSPDEQPKDEQRRDEQRRAQSKTDATRGEGDVSPAKATDNVRKDGKQAGPQPEKAATDGGNAAGAGAHVGQQAAHRDMLNTPGDPEPEKPEVWARPE